MFDNLEWHLKVISASMLSLPRPISRKLYSIRHVRPSTETEIANRAKGITRQLSVNTAMSMTGVISRLFHIKFLVNGELYGKRYHRSVLTRSAWQSQTWGRPAPQYRVDCQFSYSKFLSQQRHLPSDPENCTLEPRGIWNCVRLQRTSTSGVTISVPIRFSFVDQSSPSRLENFGEGISTSPDVIDAHTLNFKPNFKFSRFFFLGGGPRARWGMG